MTIPTKRHLPLLVLFLLSTIIGEMTVAALMASNFVQIFRVASVVAFYGAGVVLVREVARRYHLGWPAVVCLGLAYAGIEEGLALQTFFTPDIYGQHILYGRALETNWLWTVVIGTYHALWSIVIPIALTELLFPAHKDSPWLTKRESAFMGVLFVIAAGMFHIILYVSSSGYRASWLHMSLVVAAVASLTIIALRLKRPERSSVAKTQHPPSVARVRYVTFAFALIWFFLMALSFFKIPIHFSWALGASLIVAISYGYIVRGWARRGLLAKHFVAMIIAAIIPGSLLGLLLSSGSGHPINVLVSLLLLIALPLSIRYFANKSLITGTKPVKPRNG